METTELPGYLDARIAPTFVLLARVVETHNTCKKSSAATTDMPVVPGPGTADDGRYCDVPRLRH